VNAEHALNSSRTSGVELVYCDFTGVQRGKITTVDDLAKPSEQGIQSHQSPDGIHLLDTVVPIKGTDAVREFRMLPDPETFTVLPWLSSHTACDARPPPDISQGAYGQLLRVMGGRRPSAYGRATLSAASLVDRRHGRPVRPPAESFEGTLLAPIPVT
jgi:hypothetical protein